MGFLRKSKENILNIFIFLIIFLIIFSYLFPLWYSLFISDIFIFVNAWDEETYLTYQGALGSLSGPGYFMGAILTLLFQELNVSGAIQNLISDTIFPILTLYFIYKIFIFYQVQKIDAFAFSSLILFSSVLFNHANPLISSIFLREINMFMAGFENYLSILRTPEPQLSYLILSIFVFLFIKTNKKIFLIIPLFLTYFYVAIVYLYCLIILVFISKLKFNFKTILFSNIFAYSIISIGLIIMDKLFLQKSEIITNSFVYILSNEVVFPIILFVNIFYSFFIYLIYFLKKNDIQRKLFLISLCTLFIIFFISNFQILTGYMMSYKNYFDYGLSIIIGISTVIFLLSLSIFFRRIIFIILFSLISYLSFTNGIGTGFDYEENYYKIWVGNKINDENKKMILNKPENSIILELDLNSKIAYSKAKTIIPMFSYQYTFPFINKQCENIQQLHFNALQQYKNDFPDNVKNIEYLEKQYKYYVNSIEKSKFNLEQNNLNYKKYCSKLNSQNKFTFIEIIESSPFIFIK